MKQRLTAWRHGLLALAALAIVATPVCASKKSASDQPSAKRPTLLRTVLYEYGLGTARVAVDLGKARLQVLAACRYGGVEWHSFECKITPAEGKYLRRLVEDADLRNFQPKSAWFGKYDVEKLGLPEGGADLVVAWDDKEVVLRIPPTGLRSRVPKSAARVYTLIDVIARRIGEMEEKCIPTACIRVIDEPPNSPEIRRLHEEMNSISKRTLPKDRDGWW